MAPFVRPRYKIFEAILTYYSLAIKSVSREGRVQPNVLRHHKESPYTVVGIPKNDSQFTI